ncbi:hypothetical protein BGZ97_000283 [Linnemannia gamsii]|uniref:Uncharacterized protein n=1 Tax=Linnemannia gamsii TaxID=64522 RepID=A0A9P6R151_9FUNG|nr:hypothetical protein BGZ97_000283 [Linnemannia gamsii]
MPIPPAPTTTAPTPTAATTGGRVTQITILSKPNALTSTDIRGPLDLYPLVLRHAHLPQSHPFPTSIFFPIGDTNETTPPDLNNIPPFGFGPDDVLLSYHQDEDEQHPDYLDDDGEQYGAGGEGVDHDDLLNNGGRERKREREQHEELDHEYELQLHFIQFGEINYDSI